MTKKKKILITLLSAAAVLVSAIGVTLGILLNRKPDKPPAAQAGVIYQTESKIIWSGVAGVAYISFEYVEEPTTPEENQLYGYVFKVMADGSTDVTKCVPWLMGLWELEENDGVYGALKLTAFWDSSNLDATKLTDATSGEAKTYALADGAYKIGVSFSQGANLTFALDPTKKLNDGGPSNPSEPCTSHVDENNDGKCDKCGENMPRGDVKLHASLSAETSSIKAKIELKTDKTWTLFMCYYGDAFTPSANGRWNLDPNTYVLTLIVENDEVNLLAEDSYNLDIDYETQKYSKTIAIAIPDNVPTIGGQSLDFTFTQDVEKPVEKEVEKTLNASSGSQKAKIELYNDKTWEVLVCFFGDAYNPMASGTWELGQDYNITLTVTKDEADVLADDTYILTISYTTFEYSATITMNIPQVGSKEFTFDSAVAQADHYTVTYDLNYTNAPEAETATTETFTSGGVSKEYIKTAPTVPTREGYKFAGWYTEKNPTLTNGASDKEYLFGTKLSTYNSAPESIKNDVMAITGSTTLYARWVEVKEISTAAELKDMANDLTGWYKLTADITLTGEWMPIGLYYGAYEFYQPSWWLYAFRGTLEGNGHTISGLKLSTISYDGSASATDGSANGTTALFSCVVNCTVKDLTIEGANITIDNCEAEPHAYVSVLAAFVQGDETLFENCTVKNATINLSFKNIWYVAVAGLFGGHWGGKATNCNVLDTTITVSTATDRILEGYSYEAVYVGGLVGEGYAKIKNCKSEANITYTLNDTRTTVAENVPVNVYLGGAMGSSTYLQGVVNTGNVTMNYTKAVGKANVYFGGLSGLQRYGYIQNCMTKASMNFANNNAAVVTGQTVAAGGILGGFDAMYGLMGAMFEIEGDRISNCIDISSLNATGTAVFTNELQSIGAIPMDAIVRAIAPSLGVDLTAYTKSDGTLNYFGIFNSVRVNGSASAADADGNVKVASESDLYGEAVKSTLGDGWTYANGKLPTPKTVA